MTADPFAALPTKTPTATKAAAPKKEPAVATTKTAAKPAAAPEPVEETAYEETDYSDMDGLAVFMAGLTDELLFDDDEIYEAPVAFVPYVRPNHGDWVPVKITAIDLEMFDQQWVVPDPVNRPDFDTTVPVPQFRMELDHVAPCYGQRRSPYKLSLPVLSVTMKAKRGTNYKNNSGRRLQVAAGIATRETKVKIDRSSPEALLASLQPLADELLGKIIMCKVKHVEKKYTDSNAKQDPVTGAYIRDEDGNLVKEVTETIRIFDNLDYDVHAVPPRWIEVEGKAYEIDWNTIGRVTIPPIKAGTIVVAVAEDGEEIAAVRTADETWVRYIAPEGTGAEASNDVFKGAAAA